MQVNHHILFRPDEAPVLAKFLIANNISFKSSSLISSIDILESDPHWKDIYEICKQEDVVYQNDTIFSKQELLNAQWLRVYSQWRFGYPQPENAFLTQGNTYSLENHCSNCGQGLVQQNPFRIKKAVSWGKRSFAELHWIGDELFISDHAKDVLIKHNISGISFLNVQNKNGKDTIPGVSQLNIQATIPKGLIADRPSIRLHETCPVCGATKYVLSGIGQLSYNKTVFVNQPNIVKTSDMFGSMHYCTRMILVDQKVYRTITENQLGQGLVFEPIYLE